MANLDDSHFAPTYRGEAERCSVCERTSSDPLWSSRLLGTDDALCHDCFDCWYHKGMTDPAAIRERVLATHGNDN
jgi:hypothetical protein